MSTDSRLMFVLFCDGCEEQFEDGYDDAYFEDEESARESAKRLGWRNVEHRDWCKRCKVDVPHQFKNDGGQVCRICCVHLSDHDNPDRIPVILPGQLPIDAALAGVR